MANELKDYLVRNQWKQDKPEDSLPVKKYRHTKMLNYLRDIATKVMARKKR